MSRKRDEEEYLALIAEYERRASMAGDWTMWLGPCPDGSPRVPTSKQREFLDCQAFEAMYGGAASGGKSDALLMAALQYVHVPGYAALILRRTFKDLALPGAIMDRALSWLIPKGVKWDKQEHRFTFPSGATLTFGFMDTDRDRFRYQGAEAQFLAFDELTQFPEQWYRYPISRMRKAKGSAVPIRVRSASNPGGIGHDWVKRRFVDEATRQDRVFIPARMQDNPHVDESYRHSLAQLDPATRRQLEDGIWIRDSGGLVYSRFSEARNTIPSLPSDTRFKYHVLAMDYGYTDATSFTVLAWNDNDPKVYIIRSFKMRGLTPSDAADQSAALVEEYAPDKVVGDIGGLGKGYVEEARKRFHLPIEAADKKNKRGYIDLMNGDFARGRIVLVKDTCQDLIDEYLELPWDDTRQKESSGFDNHCSDGALYGWRACNAFHETEVEESPKLGTREYYEAVEHKMLEQRLESLDSKKEWWEQE